MLLLASIIQSCLKSMFYEEKKSQNKDTKFNKFRGIRHLWLFKSH